MKIFSSNVKKIALLILISIIIFVAWEAAGFQKVYENALVGVTNVVLDVVKTDTRIEIEPVEGKNINQLKVYTRIKGRKGNYQQETGGLFQPFVIVLSWQFFLFFVLKRKDALKLMGVNAAIFVLIQILFLILLTGYYNSEIQSFLFDMMLDNFYIVGLILVIKDNIMFPVFRSKLTNP